jgi:glutamate dehydrogenase
MSIDRAATVRKVLQAAKTVQPKVSKRDEALFQNFCAGVAQQLRAPFLERHGAEGIPARIRGTFDWIKKRKADEVLVQIVPNGDSRCLVQTCMQDQAFIVDTVRLLVRSYGAKVDAGFNAVLGVERSPAGIAKSIGGADVCLESVLQLEVDGLDPADFELFSQRLEENLRLSRSMVEDFKPMVSVLERLAAKFDRRARKDEKNADRLHETAAFLNWLLSDNFVFMGLVSSKGRFGFERKALSGIMPDSTHKSWSKGAWSGLPIRVRKSEQESPVHRSGRIDEVMIRLTGKSGETEEEVFIRGMFTFRAVSQPSRHVPVLRKVLSSILANDHALPGSWRYKGMANVFDSLPTEFLFIASLKQIGEIIDRVLDAEAEQEVRVHFVQNEDKEISFVLAAMPKNQYSAALCSEMQRLLTKTTGATYADQGLFVGRYDTVLAHFFLTGSMRLGEEALETLHDRLAGMATPWERRLHDEISSQQGTALADELCERYENAFEGLYLQQVSPARAYVDLLYLEQLSDERTVVADLFVDHHDRLNLRMYQVGDVRLTDILPVLDNFGLVVQNQFADPVRPNAGEHYTIDTFRLLTDDPIGLMDCRERLISAVEAIFAGKFENDGLNRLVIGTGLNWEQADLIRAYLGYNRQLGRSFTAARTVEILLSHPAMVRALWGYFKARFDPTVENGRKKKMDAAAAVLANRLEDINDRDEDKLFRILSELMASTLRTNFFRTDRIAHYISFKVDHDLVPDMPEPRLKFEIYVHHAEMEGVHLRGGKVARGGLRWSDRVDFRTEIMGLVNTQMVKNVLIVPTGSKGGFRMKHHVADFAERRAKADELYTFLIRGLLDLTDNIVNDQVVLPPGVIPHDAKDPYLVVAADKGTAHLSDTANSISRAYGFWLDDAFASGGSNGYDHKKVGITARGGWQCVRRHFAEMGLNPKTEIFSVMGIGDMSGDVFGNGLIEYNTIKLVGAFNHRHIFLDPNPNPDRSFEERKRLFEACKGWDAYNTKLLSKGGGIFERRSKSIALSPEVKKMLGVLKDELQPEVVIRLLLRLPVDLFWSAGIGTYVKASWESQRDADDAGNDILRVNANELRCRSVGEGGNLGFTHAGRIEYALGGGRINTDAVDNSGGVDMSDHEVNLKILLAGPVKAGKLSEPDRNKLIEKLTEEIAQQVLLNNHSHSRQLSLDQIRSARNPFPFARAIQWVSEESGVSLAALGLPDSDTIAKRAEMRQGLTRPELAVLGAHVKLRGAQMLEEADPARIPGSDERLMSYFVPEIRKKYGDLIPKHMLADNIKMMLALNEMVEDVGAVPLPLLMDLSDRPMVDIIGAWFRISSAVGFYALRDSIGNAKAPLETRYQAWVLATDSLFGMLAISLGPGEPLPTEEQVAMSLEVLSNLARRRGRVDRARLEGVSNSMSQKGLSRALSDRVANMVDLTIAREIAMLRVEMGDSVRDAIVRYLAIGNASGLLPAVHRIERRRGAGQWDQLAIGILRGRYISLLRELVRRTPLDAELKLGVDRASFRLGRGALSSIGKTVDLIVGEGASVGALLVAEERIRAAVLR